MASHFEEKKGFHDLEFDGKKSQTAQGWNQTEMVSHVTCVTGGSYLEHFTPEGGEGATYGKELHRIVEKYKAEETLVYIGADSTKVNTGPNKGAITTLENLLDAQLYWVSNRQ